jgi:hypothetical protein
MRHRLLLSTLIAVSVIGASASALAQGAGAAAQTGAAPSGLPGDDPAHPGFPGKVGQ